MSNKIGFFRNQVAGNISYNNIFIKPKILFEFFALLLLIGVFTNYPNIGKIDKEEYLKNIILDNSEKINNIMSIQQNLEKKIDKIKKYLIGELERNFEGCDNNTSKLIIFYPKKETDNKIISFKN